MKHWYCCIAVQSIFLHVFVPSVVMHIFLLFVYISPVCYFVRQEIKDCIVRNIKLNVIINIQ